MLMLVVATSNRLDLCSINSWLLSPLFSSEPSTLKTQLPSFYLKSCSEAYLASVDFLLLHWFLLLFLLLLLLLLLLLVCVHVRRRIGRREVKPRLGRAGLVKKEEQSGSFRRSWEVSDFFVLFCFELLMLMGLLSMIELSCLHSAGHGICSWWIAFSDCIFSCSFQFCYG